MKARNAASTAMVWYLLMSPGGMFNYQPYSWWKFVDSFPTRKMCEEVRVEFEKQMMEAPLTPDFLPGPARCVSEDDPGLAPPFNSWLISVQR